MARSTGSHVLLLTLALAASCIGFSPSQRYLRWTRTSRSPLATSSEDDFDGKSFEEALRNMSPTIGKNSDSERDAVIADIREEQISRQYPFDDYTEQLPILPDCNNYYSGKFGDYTWHQNADQVFVYLPIDDDIARRDVEIKFEALSVDIKINDVDVVKFATIERLIPDGSFWVFETDKDGQKYIQLDIEKRFRMINWKNLFVEAPVTTESETENRRKLLESLFSANKGMSKMTGKDPESMDEMLKNEALMKMIREVNENPQLLEDENYSGDEEELYADAEAVDGENQGYIEYDESGAPNVVIDAPFDVKGFVRQSADKYFPKDEASEDDASEDDASEVAEE